MFAFIPCQNNSVGLCNSRTFSQKTSVQICSIPYYSSLGPLFLFCIYFFVFNLHFLVLKIHQSSNWKTSNPGSNIWKQNSEIQKYQNYLKWEALPSAINYYHGSFQQNALSHQKYQLLSLFFFHVRRDYSYKTAISLFKNTWVNCVQQRMGSHFCPGLNYSLLDYTIASVTHIPLRLFLCKGNQEDEFCFAKTKQFAFYLMMPDVTTSRWKSTTALLMLNVGIQQHSQSGNLPVLRRLWCQQAAAHAL